MTGTLLGLLIISLIFVIGMFIKIMNLKKELTDARNETNDVKKILVGKQRRAEDVIAEHEKQGPELEIFDGLVRKKEIKQGGSTGYTYEVNGDKIPDFKNIDEGICYINGFLTRPTDPTIMNLAGYGCVMLTDTYIALKLVLRSALMKIKNFPGNAAAIRFDEPKEEGKNDTAESV